MFAGVHVIPPERASQRRRRSAAPRLGLGVLAMVAAFAFAGCPGDLADPERFGPATCRTPIDVPSEIFVPSCGSALCHGGDEPAADLDLVAGDVLNRLIDVPSAQCADWVLIDRLNPDESLLLHKLEERFPDCGDKMPLAGSLSREQIACVRDWVFSAVGLGDGGLLEAGAGDADAANPDDAAGDGADSGEASN
jgi:hypothetical protein